jgi:ribosomal protein S18 acetylase RimI-like enzyme
LPPEASLNRSRQQFAELLPAGKETDGTWILLIVDEAGVEVGTLWVGPHSDRAGVAYVYDIEIVEEQRGHGIGRAAMTAAESLVREAGKTEIGLNVFGFNEPARRLYDSLGYRVVATVMTKSIEP